MRINKYISDSGYCSRREADKLIEEGAVTINGRKARVGSQVLAGQEVKIYGEVVSGTSKTVFIAYNKPLGIVTTTDADDPGNIIRAIGHEERIFPVGRLDKDSIGLIILTNDGDIVNKMLRVNNDHDKEYAVTVDRLVNEDFIKKMENGVPILGVVTRKCEVKKTGTHSFNIVLRQGLNRQIRRMCDHLGYKVLRLERIRVMHIKLGNIKLGKWRNLTSEEVETLYQKTASSVKTEEASKKKSRPKPQSPGAKTPTSKNRPANSNFSKREVNKSTGNDNRRIGKTNPQKEKANAPSRRRSQR
ncbi:23S rRNA pseudouridine2604 synthase [Dysgonomonas sp. PFB1-18]|uniref:23S rRNA pseudouridine(2604) synthase RluF n=1 Tax=unclassified Dysgonomonas TaxID=2630389 RepID=UPI0024772C5A|nr:MULTISPECIES: 23S rRNA pseudouridine(2604) synthase RluF [unclassified Dysgonomonas]MDH6309855.1 23S rRNA pseudouridine2604 synthase [Dysgonomonas sp. PF1-14]MDH6339399.1 23S rRNA pseudouridine2604 synthase [Dysgonomonas sp. PF1-16]MDH6380898.1 23S rRNA pseudouridine2604 synthase [Dysgonomonas sp. PFB1-18]MDH6397907.1 23S rRNA pseudouridine2604 synthase [Dysgonomonas sp. PF1-23]